MSLFFLQVPTSTRCINDIFHFNREGSELLSGSEYFCGSGSMERKSFLNRAVISYISTPYTTSATFAKTTLSEATQSKDEMTINVQKQMTPESELGNNDANSSSTDAVKTEATVTSPPALSTLTRKPTATPTTTWDFLLAAFTWRKNFPSSTFTTTSSLNIPSSSSSPLPSPPPPSLPSPSSTPTLYNSSVLRRARIIDRNSAIYPSATAGAGSFSCLVEVLEPPCECGWSMSAKVAGSSTEAGIYEFPSMAGVMTVRDRKIFCGAAISEY